MRPLIEDVESRMKVRKASLIPLTIATSALSEMGRQPSTTAILTALSMRLRSRTKPLMSC